MAWQLVYTSAPALIDAGRSGFGTVARHDAIRPALQTELERISQFSREQGLSKNRILFYHRVLDLRGERYHVLSRIKDAGADYTGRTNHIAHHIVLTAAEAEQCYRTKRCSPADMILWVTSNGLWRDQWNEAARLFDSSEEIAVGAIPARLSLPAVSWGAVTGAAANAAILAPGGAATEGCWLLYREEQTTEVLPLIGEALCLHSNPWAISFSTDTQPTDRIEEISWRGVALGSPLERTARQSVRPVLDLGNPASLPPPVESARHLAETGLLKAPEPISSHSRVADTGSIERGRTLTGSSHGSTAHKGGVGGGSVSLKDRMKKGDGPLKPSKSKKFPLQGIAIGVATVIIILLASVVRNQCVIEEGELTKLVADTRIIANKIITLISEQNKEGERIPESWKEDLVSQSIPIAGYRIVSFSFKSEFNEAREKIDDLKPQKNEDLLKSFEILAKPQPTKGELLSKLIEKIKEVKTSAEKLAQEEADKKQKKEAERQKLVIAQAKMEQEAAEARKKSEEAKAASQAVMTPNPSPTPNPQKILKIEFWKPVDPEDTASKKYFNDQMIISGWSWKTNDFATSISQLDASARDANNWITNSVNSSRDQFNARATNSGFCFLRKEDSSKEVSITITSSGEVFTNKIAFQPIELEKEGEKYICKISPNIASCIQLFKTPTYSIAYHITTNPNYIGDTPESIADQINKKLKELEESIVAAQTKLDQSHSSNNEFKSEAKPSNLDNESLDKAGEKLSLGLNFKGMAVGEKEGFPEQLKSYTAWLDNKEKEHNSKKRGEETFKEYLTKVFEKIFSCEGGISKTEVRDSWLKQTQSVNDLFDDLIKNKNQLESNSRDQQRKANDTAFKNNVYGYFTEENHKNLKAFINPPPRPTPTPDYRKSLERAKKDRADFEESLKKPQAEIIIKDANKTTRLIFTAQ